MRDFVWTLLLFAPAALGASVYRCEQDGRVVFTDRPCSAGAQPLPERSPSVLPGGAAADLAKAHDERRRRANDARRKADAQWLQAHEARKAEEARLRQALVEGRVIQGMTAAQVRQAWGSPDRIERSAQPGVQERWIWRSGKKVTRSVTFRDGRVASLRGGD